MPGPWLTCAALRLVERLDGPDPVGRDVVEDRVEQRAALGDVVRRRGAVAGDEQAALGRTAVDEARPGRGRRHDAHDVAPREREALAARRADAQAGVVDGDGDPPG